MCTSGTPTVYLGWALPSFQAKNQYVVVPLSAHTMQELQCSLCIPLWDLVGSGDHT